MHKSIKYYNTDFHNDGYSIMMSEKYFYFRKKTKTFGKNVFFPPRKSYWIHHHWKYFPNYVLLRFL